MLWHHAGAVRQQAPSSWLHTNYCSCPSSHLPNPFSLQHMLELSPGEQEEEPSEMNDQLRNSDALALFSSRKELFHCSLLFLFSCLSFHKKVFGHCLIIYPFLSVRQVDLFPLGMYKIQVSIDLPRQRLFISKKSFRIAWRVTVRQIHVVG